MVLAGSLAVVLLGSSSETRAQGAATEEELGWSNSTNLSVVVAKGNADTQSFGLDNKLRHHWKQANFQLRLDLFQTNEADDRFLQIEPGLTWLPGEEEPTGSTTVVEPPIETEAARLFVEGKYDREIREDLSGVRAPAGTGTKMPASSTVTSLSEVSGRSGGSGTTCSSRPSGVSATPTARKTTSIRRKTTASMACASRGNT
jgi:hypothetical protein